MARSTDTRVASYDCGTDTVIAAAANDREGLLIVNDSVAADLYVRFGSAAATSTNYSLKLAKGDQYELSAIEYGGLIHAIWSAADAGFVRVTEFV